VCQSEELKEFDEDLRAALDAQDHAAVAQVKDARRYTMRKLLADRLKLYRKSWCKQRDGENGRISDDTYILEIPPHDLEMERRRAAAALFGSIQSDNQVALVKDLATICCGKSAAKIGKSTVKTKVPAKSTVNTKVPAKSTANTKVPTNYTEKQFFRGADPSNGHCLFCNSDLSSMDLLHQVTHTNHCFSRHHQIRNRTLLSRFQNCEWGGCKAYFPPFFDGTRQQSEIACHIRRHINNTVLLPRFDRPPPSPRAFVCLWSKGRCALPFDSRWKLRQHMKTAHNIVNSIRSMSPILCCSETHLYEFSWEDHCSGHLKSLQDFICAPSVSRPGQCPFCLGNERLPSSKRYTPFNSLLLLQGHIQKEHPVPLDARIQHYPHPLYQKASYSIDELQKHLQEIQGIPLPQSSRKRGCTTPDRVTPKWQKVLINALADTDEPSGDDRAEVPRVGGYQPRRGTP